jgi:transposase-like protein
VSNREEQRYRCPTGGTTFAATWGTLCDRLKKGANLVALVRTLLCHGCPIQAIVAAFGLDERTVTAWQARAGQRCQRVHEHLV